MAITEPGRDEIAPVIELVLDEARRYLEGLDRRPALDAAADASARSFRAPLPEVGCGAESALRELVDRGFAATAATSGPRCFHFVIGGVTPAALGADWLTTVLDQPAYAWASSPLGVELEVISLGWLRELFGLPASWSGVLTTGATMANFAGLAAARQWWGERLGHDVSQRGLAGAPPVTVLSSGYIHASAIKCLALLGIGRGQLEILACDRVGRLDLLALERRLAGLGGAPAILIGNAGEVNAGDFDPVSKLADFAHEHGAWLHVDGAFGLFAALTERTRHLVAGVERAHSVAADGHKWLNVPYHCGFAFVSDPGLLARAFAYDAAYLPAPSDPRPVVGSMGPESSRRARALAVWATLRAYGRTGYRRLVEGHLDLAQRLATQIDQAPELERLAEVPLCIVCFRLNLKDRDEAALDALNRSLGEAIAADGRVMAGTTVYDGKVALRPAIVNWRTREADIDELVVVVRELGARLVAPAS